VTDREFNPDAFPASFDIYKSPGFALMTQRLEYSMEIGESWAGNSPFIDEDEMQETMHQILLKSHLDGFVIVTRDAFPVLETSRSGLPYMEALPAIGIMMADVVQRAERENIISRPDELTFRGVSGEFVVTRYFQNLEWQFILMAYAEKKCAYRQATNCVLQLCEPLLADFVYI
jgi:hypothetical protein